MLSRAASPGGDPALGATRLEMGTVVRVESADGETWSGRVTSVSDQLFGLRGYMNVNGQFRVRDRVTVHVGRGSSLVSIRAQVLDRLPAGAHGADVAAVRPAHRRHGGAGALILVRRRTR